MKSINIKDDLEGKATRLEELAFASPLDEMPSASSLDRVGDRTTAPAKEMEPPQPVEYRALDASDISLMCKMPAGASPDIEPDIAIYLSKQQTHDDPSIKKTMKSL